MYLSIYVSIYLSIYQSINLSENWERDPFKLNIEGDKLYGRGAQEERTAT